MKRSALLLLVGFIAGLLGGALGWHLWMGSKSWAENQRLREGQAELLRLRGQAAQLRRDAQEARAAAVKAAVVQPQEPESAAAPTAESPVLSFTNQVTARVGWQHTLVTGGWRLPSGKRAFVLVKPASGPQADSVEVGSQIVEIPESLLAQLGLAGFQGDSGDRAGGVFTPEQSAQLAEMLKQSAGANVIAAPRVTTLSGRQAQVSSTQDHELPDGRRYRTGPVISLLPTISSDGQSVDLSVDAQINLARPPP